MQQGGVEFMAHTTDVAACAPGRASLVTALRTANHQIGAANDNSDYWYFWHSAGGTTRDANGLSEGRNAELGRDDATSGTLTTKLGPWETHKDPARIVGAVWSPGIGFPGVPFTTYTFEGDINSLVPVGGSTSVNVNGVVPNGYNGKGTVGSIVGNTVVIGGPLTDPGPYVSGGAIVGLDANDVPRSGTCGGLFSWLKRAGVTTALVGKMQNQSHTPDFRGSGVGGTMNDGSPSLAQARGQHTRTPPDIDFYAGSAGAVSVNASNYPAAFYQEEILTLTRLSSGNVALQLDNSQDSVTQPNVGDTLVVQGTLIGAYNQVYDRADDATYIADGFAGSGSAYLMVPRTPIANGTGVSSGGTATCWRFTGGQHAPRHGIICKKTTPNDFGEQGVGVIKYNSVDVVGGDGTGSDPLNASPLYETDALADEAIEFISTRGTQEPWFLYLAPQVPHLGWDAFEVDDANRKVISVVATAGSSTVTITGFSAGELDGWQLNSTSTGGVDTRIPGGVILDFNAGAGTYTMKDPDGTNVNATGSSGTSTIDAHKVPFTGFAGWLNTPGLVPPTMGDQAITSYSVTSNVATIICPSHGFSTGQAVFITGTGVIDGYYPRLIKLAGNDTFSVPKVMANVGSTSIAAQAIGQAQLRDWQGRQEKLISVDIMMGRIFALLEQRGWIDQTAILFTGDNGQQQGEHSIDENNQVWGNTKSLLWHASQRTGLYVRWPGWTPGSKFHRPTWHADIPLGILDWFGLDDIGSNRVLGFNPHVDRDGVSLKRIVDNPGSSYPDRAFYYYGSFFEKTQSDGFMQADGLKLMRSNEASPVERVYATLEDEGEAIPLTIDAGQQTAMRTRMYVIAEKRGNAYRTL